MKAITSLACSNDTNENETMFTCSKNSIMNVDRVISDFLIKAKVCFFDFKMSPFYSVHLGLNKPE